MAHVDECSQEDIEGLPDNMNMCEQFNFSR